MPLRPRRSTFLTAAPERREAAASKPDNAAGLFSNQDIDGGLIGGAALNAADFLAICSAAAQRG